MGETESMAAAGTAGGSRFSRILMGILGLLLGFLMISAPVSIDGSGLSAR